MKEKRAKARKYIGKTTQVLLPIEIQRVVNEYTFTFEIRDVS